MAGAWMHGLSRRLTNRVRWRGQPALPEPGAVVNPASPIEWWAGDHPHWGMHKWFGPKDVAIAVLLAQGLPRPPRILEVGLWRGSWSMHLAKNLGLREVTAIDPYPGLDDVRAATVAEFEGEGVALKLYEDWNALPLGDFDVVSVDGEHSEAAALRDLRSAADRLSAPGFIVVDDWLTPHFPGVNSAVHRFMAETDFVIVIYSEWKAILARTAEASHFSDHLVSVLAQVPEVPFSFASAGNPRFGLSSGYEEVRAVRGFEPIASIGKPGRGLVGPSARARAAGGLAAKEPLGPNG